ncbi:MAG: CHAT domain-containing protein [Vicinamibacterales bacterium]
MSTPTFRIPGVTESGPRPTLAETVDGVQPQQRVRVESGRAAAQLQDVNGEFAEIVLTGGVRLWGATDVLTRDLATGSSRGRHDDVPVWGVRLGAGDGSRGAGKDLAIQVVETFDLQIAGSIADFIKTRVEAGMEPGGLLRQCVTSSAAAFDTATPISGGGPTLVFLHGTASSTEGSFGGLWDAVGANRILRVDNPGARINAIFKAYGNRVFAFDHRSLSESPIVNAEALMTQLGKVVPGGSELHLVSHSRGGMIGELLCRGMRRQGAPFDALDIAQFADDEHRQLDLETLPELGRLLKEQRYKVGRFVRVACPAAGTTLADGRLDRYVSMLVNVAGLVTGLGADPLYKALTNLLAAVLKERTDPTSLPGLEAMMPKSPLTRILNRRDVQTAADLHVLGGDLAVRGFWSALKALATDFFFLEDHDLVVNTPSMLRGTPRTAAVKYFIDTDGDVSHFNYFRRADTADRLADFLTSGSAEFRNLDVQPYEVDAKSYQKRDGAPMPTLVLIPGFMGSHLADANGRVWIDPARLAQGAFEALEHTNTATPEALVGPYTRLVTHLAASHHVVPFAYDWRQSAAANVSGLIKLLATLLDDKAAKDQPIRILTHGAGGLVLHALLASEDKEERDVWAHVVARSGARAVMLGHPFDGTVHALLPLLYRGALLEGLASIDLKHRERALVPLFAGFDGLLELLPERVSNGNATGWFARDRWTSPFAPPERLDDAHTFRQRLAGVSLKVPEIVQVAGTAGATPVRVSFDDGRITVDATPDGDGYSPWSAIPEALRDGTWLAGTDHGGLIASQEMGAAIVDLLSTGSTHRLGRRGVPANAPPLRPFPLRGLLAIPSDAELVAAGLGIGMRTEEIPAPKVRVRVVHGSLSRATSPVVVGHYDQDVLANAEYYLDRQLDGRLSHLRAMRRYPGPIGTSAVEIRPADNNIRHPGAIVVGLGTVGTLTPGALIRTLEEGLTAYGVEKVSEQVRRPVGTGRSADLRTIPAYATALLVGSGETGLSLRDSVHALLRAVLGANDRLAAPAAEAAKSGNASVPKTARIETLDLIELYEDRAVEALRVLQALGRDADFKQSLAIEPMLQIGSEGRQRVSFEEPAAWWQRLRVSEHPASIDPKFPTSRKVLKFEAYTERARIDAYAVSSQREVAQAFIDDALKTTASSERLGRTLFEMLVPNDIKDRAPDQRDTVLLLDAASAAIPWELFEDGLQSDDRPRDPLAIEAGLIRQLVDEYPRQQVRQATGDRALVIGNPIVTDPQFPNLPGAEREANAVAEQLAPSTRVGNRIPGGRWFHVECLVSKDATPQAILAALHERPWRVLHLALHGVFNFPDARNGNQPVTGVVVADGVFLQPEHFNQMRYVPELVFLNCCHGGFTGGEHVPRHPELAANLATQFIKMGAKAVVAAGWAVNDQAAEAFARGFYGRMLDGEHFGDATKAARQEIHRQFPQYNTWGAYQCYGDPAYVLTAAKANGGARTPVFVREVIIEAETIASDAKIADESDCVALRKRLDALVQNANEKWKTDPRLCAALGAAYGELSDFDRAIEFYETARASEKATFAAVMLEQLANLETRYAEHIWRNLAEQTPEALVDIDERFTRAHDLLDQLLAIGPSAERHSLLGALEKRRAMTRLKKTDAATALKRAEGHYRRAVMQHRAFYPFVNSVVVGIARGWLIATRKAGDEEMIAARVGELKDFEADLKDATDFWSLGFFAEAELLRLLHGATSATDSDGLKKTIDLITGNDLVERFRNAQKRGRSHREMDSVVTQIRFLTMFARVSKQPNVGRICKALEALAAELMTS